MASVEMKGVSLVFMKINWASENFFRESANDKQRLARTQVKKHGLIITLRKMIAKPGPSWPGISSE
jgi:hypothetical protein